MGKMKVFAAITGAVAKVGGKALLKCKKNSPELLLVGGIACGVAAVVTAVIATKKIYSDEELIEIEEDIEGLEAELKEEKDKNIRKDIRKDAARAWRRKIFRLTRLFALPVGLTILSIVLRIGLHGVLKTRYLAAAAAYTALDSSFRDYRQRIRDIAGEEAEQRFFDGIDEVEVTTTDENGNVEKKTVNKQKSGIVKRNSPYEFDWNKMTAPFRATTDSAHNFADLHAAQQWANDMLHARGYLFLNEVLEELDLKATPAGQLVGWLTNGDGDGYVDFGISEYYTDDFSDTLNGNVPNHHLNFNCDGIIYEKI